MEDIPLLVQFLTAKFAARIGKRIDGITPQTMRHLSEYLWPGNIREMENLLERAVILATGTTLDIVPELLPLVSSAPATPSSVAEPGKGSLEEIERSHILAVLDKTDWVIDGARGAAKVLDLHPNTLRSRLKRLGISRSRGTGPTMGRGAHELS